MPVESFFARRFDTFSGTFHADEALAVHLLGLLPDNAVSTVVRTRDPAILQTCDIVVDVGGEYDAERNRFDHHQRSFATTFPGHGTKLSSAGLVYMHFGRDIIKHRTGLSDSEDLDVLYEKIYTNFVEPFDANDNGISVISPSALEQAGLAKQFDDGGFSLAAAVSRFNYDHSTDGADKNKSKDELQADEDHRFMKATALVGQQFEMEVADRFHAWLPGRAAVEKAYGERFKHDSQGRIMVLGESVPWADHLYAFEKKAAPVPEGVHPEVLYVLFPENPTDSNSKWRVRAVSKESGRFDNRKDLPDQWKGLRDDELSSVCGVPGCIFVHASGFIGGNKTFDGAFRMASLACDL